MIAVDANPLIDAVNRDTSPETLTLGLVGRCVVWDHDRGLAMDIAACRPEDHDFGRFPGVRHVNPLRESA